MFLLAACSAAACGSSTLGHGANDGGNDGGHSCTLDPIGMFTFHVHNVGAQTLTWDLGCSKTLPIWLHLPEGDLPTGPGSVDFCELTCEQIYTGPWFPGACTDCGAGVSGSAAPGASGDIAWDRRVYSALTFDPACRYDKTLPGGNGSSTCASGHAVAPAATQAGTITICPGRLTLSTCMDPATGKTIDQRKVEFTVDTTGSDAVIDVQ
ncbi:MAG TPA: hypothetical protein VIF57_24820 [Polyangia bacterium]